MKQQIWNYCQAAKDFELEKKTGTNLIPRLCQQKSVDLEMKGHCIGRYKTWEIPNVDSEISSELCSSELFSGVVNVILIVFGRGQHLHVSIDSLLSDVTVVWVTHAVVTASKYFVTVLFHGVS